MISEVGARSAGTCSTTDIGSFVASHSDRDRSHRRARKWIGLRACGGFLFGGGGRLEWRGHARCRSLEAHLQRDTEQLS
jgi:hypothetical protein